MKPQILSRSNPPNSKLSNLNIIPSLVALPPLSSFSKSSSSRDEIRFDEKTAAPDIKLLNYPYGNQSRYRYVEDSWNLINEVINHVFAISDIPKKSARITEIIISYNIYNGLDSSGEFDSYELNNILHYCYLYAKNHCASQSSTETKGTIIIETIRNDLLNRLKIKKVGEIPRTNEWKMLIEIFSYHNIINCNKPPHYQLIISLIVIASFFFKNEIINTTKLCQIASSDLCKNSAIGLKLLSIMPSYFNIYAHMITYLSIQHPKVIHQLIEINLNKFHDFLNLAKPSDQIYLNLLKHFELWVYLGLSPIFLLNQIKNYHLFTRSFVDQIILRCLQLTNAYSELLISPSLHLLRYMDQEVDAVFMTVVEEVKFYANLARIVTMCVESKVINIIIDKQTKPLLAMEILNEMIPFAIKKSNKQLKSDCLEYYFDIPTFINKYVKPQHVLLSLIGGAHTKTFEILIQNCFPAPSSWTSLSFLLQNWQVQLRVFRTTFLPIIRNLNKHAPRKSRDFWIPFSPISKSLFDHFICKIAFICLFPEGRVEYRDVEQLITEFLNFGAKITQTTITGYQIAKKDLLSRLSDLSASAGVDSGKGRLKIIRNTSVPELIEIFLQNNLDDPTPQLGVNLSLGLPKENSKRKLSIEEKFPPSKKLAINLSKNIDYAPEGYQIPKPYRDAMEQMSLKLLAEEGAQTKSAECASQKVYQLTQECMDSSQSVQSSVKLKSYEQFFKESLSQLISECIVSEVMSGKTSIEDLKESIISEMKNILRSNSLVLTLSSQSQSLTSSSLGEKDHLPENDLLPVLKPNSATGFQFFTFSSSFSSSSLSSKSSSSMNNQDRLDF